MLGKATPGPPQEQQLFVTPELSLQASNIHYSSGQETMTLEVARTHYSGLPWVQQSPWFYHPNRRLLETSMYHHLKLWVTLMAETGTAPQ